MRFAGPVWIGQTFPEITKEADALNVRQFPAGNNERILEMY